MSAMVRLKSLVPLGAKHTVRRILRRPSGNARRYLPRGVSVEEFLRELTATGVRYAVLRWFETLPSVGEGEDIDLLVADEDLPLVESRMTPYRPFPTAQKVDLYSAGGLPRTTFGGAPYFPAPLAEAVLADAVLLHGVYRVPSPERHLDSLAYHAVHHKGRASGIPPTAGSGEQPHGRIAETLQRLAGETSTQLDLTLDGLARFLENRGFRPSGSEAEMLSAERRRLYPSPN
jgi:hypothetical protein